MNAPVAPPKSYADSAYRSNAIPAQPPHKWSQDANRAGPTRTQLRWGHYANLDTWQDVDAQLQPAARNSLDEKKEDDLYINQKRWNFDNTSKWMILFSYLKWSSIFFIPWFFWMPKSPGTYQMTRNAPYFTQWDNNGFAFGEYGLTSTSGEC
ncbi:hypothetical protein [Pseudomonas paeninsulae]|uniref:hypothetical protein n=1 Tax=Pseudomonas paeninsulae TaxID=3110772 RepID=UPI002D799F65|nr:hypothetical protein [Pseudomonas sp. IT1137]